MIELSGYDSWGRVFRPRQRVARMRDRAARLPLPEDGGTILPYGAGRSYGDSCLNDGGTVLRARDLDRFIAFDAATASLRCEAGVLLAEIALFALPRGLFLPVTPGTRFVTVGGAIANDVHGKNHHRAGTFGHHVVRFELLRSDGSRLECSATANAELFRATLGGLGLTGLITWAEIRLMRVAGPWVRQVEQRFGSLAEFFTRSEALEERHEYVVAWLDCMPREVGATRGVLFAGDRDPSPAPVQERGARTVPVTPPFSLVNNLTLRAFNELYFRSHGRAETKVVPWDQFFYPLDGLRGWNRMYGPRGFFQYQCVVPEGDRGRVALEALLARIAASGQGSFLGVLKRFGKHPPAGMLSFPRPGYTLALDFPNRGD
ncbi:MAG TPA: FAD-binding oxidoreductase, partial [Usitatibacter sp.]|nr:FAD-binding oxidoreductase [Usitatibacter sp.]